MSSQGMFQESKSANSKNERYIFLKTRVWGGRLSKAWSWGLIVEEMGHAKGIYDKYRDQIQLGKPLPAEFDWTMACLELFLVNRVHQQCLHLKELLPQLTAFQHHYTFDNSKPGQVTITLGSGNEHDCRSLYKKDPIFWCLHKLISHNFEVDDLASPAMLFGFLNDW